MDMWFSNNEAVRALAAHVCQVHCPVMAQCNDWGVDLPHEERSTQVIGGVRYNKNGAVSRSQKVAPYCDLCRENLYKIT